MYLVAESFYSSPNSRIIKQILITQNEQCISLNQDSYFEISPEDQLAVSFICNQYLQIIRICMRPHVAIDFSRFTTNATNDNQQEGVMQYQVFNVTMEASNEIELGKETVVVTFEFRSEQHNWTYAYIGFGLGVLALLMFLIFYFYQTYHHSGQTSPSKK